MDYGLFDEDDDKHESTKVIQCYCEGHCPHREERGTCETKPGGMCFASVEAHTDDHGYDYPVVSYGCLPAHEMALMQCQGALVPHAERKSIQCCDEGHLCNKKLFPMYAEDKHHKGTNLSDTLPVIVLATSICTCLMILMFMAILVLVKYRRRDDKKDKRKENGHSEAPTELGISNEAIVDIIREETAAGSLAQLIEQTSWSGSGSGLPTMVQRTISRQLEMETSIGKGRYGEVWLAKWRGEKVAVKVFITAEEVSWFRETEIYQTAMIRHENILGFIAADIKGTGGWTEMLLITEYHERGSLYDFLQEHSLNPASLLAMSRSIARGLAHLHNEIFGFQGKPSIAHRDVKSKNILVKRNGECCLADFGMAVKYLSNANRVDVPPTERSGTKRYMAPEILDRSINLENFDAHRMTDIYSFGLVLWEMTRRCAIDGQPPSDYAAPFHDHVPNDPSFEQMLEVVCVQKIRPEIPEVWTTNDILSVMSKAIQEMWHDNPAVRLTALRVKKTLNKLDTLQDVCINLN